MNNQQQEALSIHQHADCIHSAETIYHAIDQLAIAINQQLQHQDILSLVVMNGGLVFAGILLPKLSLSLYLDYIHASRYRGNTSGDTYIDFYAKPRVSLENKTILLIDDIFDEGHTLKAIIDFCYAEKAKKIYTAVLIDKLHERKVKDLTIDFTGLTAPDRYLYGFGMDYKNYLRNMPGIYAVKEKN